MAWSLTEGFPLPGARAAVPLLLLLGLLAPLQLIVQVRSILGEIRTRAREHAAVGMDFHLGRTVGRSRRVTRWLALGPERLSMVSPNAALEVARGDCQGIYTDGDDVWVQWRRSDGAPCSAWSIPVRGRSDMTELVARALEWGWPVVRVSQEAMRAARARGSARLGATAPTKMALAAGALTLPMLAPLIFIEWARSAFADDPLRLLVEGLALMFLSTCAFAAVAYWYALPMMSQAERELWELPISFEGV